ncbi:MAG: stage III sporulation protein AA [Clostridium sp.]|nr:stage III sporulation protein AA [Clostridium sp.]
MERKEEILKIFPRELRSLLGQVAGNFDEVQEIRLRTGQPLMMIIGDKEYLVRRDGGLEAGDRFGMEGGNRQGRGGGSCDRERFYLVKQGQMKETVEYMGNFSLYAAEEELRQGFLTIQGGHRIGVAGRTLAQGQDIRLMKFISFINVRVAHEIIGCADGIMDYLYSDISGEFLNTLIISPPRCGKTTLLRDIIRQVSCGRQQGCAGTSRKEGGGNSGRWIPGMSVGVVDERSELGACYQGVPQNDLGPRTDVLDCCPKSQGMMMLVRTMAPRVIAVDEIGSREDVEAIGYAKNCGCSLAATVHGSSLEDIQQKPALRELLAQMTFERLILLGREKGAGYVSCIRDGSGTILMKGAEEP